MHDDYHTTCGASEICFLLEKGSSILLLAQEIDGAPKAVLEQCMKAAYFLLKSHPELSCVKENAELSKPMLSSRQYSSIIERLRKSISAMEELLPLHREPPSSGHFPPNFAVAPPALVLPSRSQVINSLVQLSDTVLEENETEFRYSPKVWKQALRLLSFFSPKKSLLVVAGNSSCEEIVAGVRELRAELALLLLEQGEATWYEEPSPRLNRLLPLLLELELVARPPGALASAGAGTLELAKKLVADLLSLFGLAAFMDSGTFNSERHSASDFEPAASSEGNMQIFETVKSGLLRDNVVVRPQEVIVYRYLRQ